MRNTAQEKQIHRLSMIRLAARALEHAVQSVPENDLDQQTRQLIAERINESLNGTLGSKEIVHERGEYSPRTVLLHASEDLVKMAKYGGIINGNQVRNIFVKCWDALGILIPSNFYAPRPDRVEMDWQNHTLEPLLEKAFKHFGVPLEIPA
jgi:hypothetical protein